MAILWTDSCTVAETAQRLEESSVFQDACEDLCQLFVQERQVSKAPWAGPSASSSEGFKPKTFYTEKQAGINYQTRSVNGLPLLWIATTINTTKAVMQRLFVKNEPV